MQRKLIEALSAAMRETAPSKINAGEDIYLQWQDDCRAVAKGIKTHMSSFDIERFVKDCGAADV